MPPRADTLIRISSPYRAPDVGDRLRRALAAHDSIEPEREGVDRRPGPPFERRVAGRVDGDRVRVRIIGGRSGYRRGLTWGVEFHGSLEPEGEGSALRGSIVMRGRGTTLWLSRIFALVAAIAGAFITVRSLAGSIGSAFAVGAVTAAMVLAALLMVPLSDRGAAVDTQLLRDHIERLVRGEGAKGT